LACVGDLGRGPIPRYAPTFALSDVVRLEKSNQASVRLILFLPYPRFSYEKKEVNMVWVGTPDLKFKQPAGHCVGYSWKWGMMLLKTPFGERDIIQMLKNTPDVISREHPNVPDPEKNAAVTYLLQMPDANTPINGITRVPTTRLHTAQRAKADASKVIMDAIRDFWRSSPSSVTALGLTVHYEYPQQQGRHGAHCFGLFLDRGTAGSETRYRFFDPNMGSWQKRDANDLFTWVETKYLIAFQEGAVRGDPGHAANKERIMRNFRVTEIIGG
jgi:hypothetical protein